MTFSPTSLLQAVARSQRPHLTFYAGTEAAERVELSGRVLANWVVKAANFLDEEGVGRDDVVVVDLPVHWRAVAWVWATWVRGASVAWACDSAAVIVTNRPETHAGSESLVVAVPLGPFALRWDGDLPEGVSDGGDIMGQPDVLCSPGTPGTRAVADSGLSYDDLDAAIGTGTGARVGFVPHSVWELTRTALCAWRSGGSVVVFSEEIPAERQVALAATEHATLLP